jgi:hypothetical protein
MALPIAAGLKRVDRHHLVAGRHQRRDQQPTIQLDADHHRLRLAGVVSDQRVQLGNPGHPIRHPAAAQHRPGGIQQAHLVVGLGPVHADKDHPASSPAAPW